MRVLRGLWSFVIEVAYAIGVLIALVWFFHNARNVEKFQAQMRRMSDNFARDILAATREHE